MTSAEKKKLITLRLKEDGNKRSYNEITADLELELWAERHNPYSVVKNKVKAAVKK